MRATLFLLAMTVSAASAQELQMGFSSSTSLYVSGQSNVYCRIETSADLADWASDGSLLHVYTAPLTVPFDAIPDIAFFRGLTLPTNWVSLNNSFPDVCAEHDNVAVMFKGNVQQFAITATHPSYTPSDYLCNANFDNCPAGTNADYEFPDPTTWNTSTGSYWASAYRKSLFWRPRGMDYAVNGSWLPGATNVHELDIGKNIPGTSEWPGFLTVYADGYIRLIPFPPAGQSSVCMGSSVLVGPADPAERPYSDIASLDLRLTSETLFITYRSGGSATIDFSTVSRTSAVLKVSGNYATNQPFCTLRSMFVTNGNSDCDTVTWTDNSITTTNRIMDFVGGSGTNWLFSRRTHSIQRDSAPDIRIIF
jgi:hypothetical protein